MELEDVLVEALVGFADGGEIRIFGERSEDPKPEYDNLVVLSFTDSGRLKRSDDYLQHVREKPDAAIHPDVRVFEVKDKEVVVAIQGNELRAKCSCEDFTFRTSKRGMACKHIVAALRAIGRGDLLTVVA